MTRHFFVDIYPQMRYYPSMKRIMIFDLDSTVIDSNHRTPKNLDGSIKLAEFAKMNTKENIFKDTLLPLANVMKKAIASKDFVIVATARIMADADFEFLKNNNIEPNLVLSRSENEKTKPDADLKFNKLNRLFNLKQFKNSEKIMFDDNSSVLSKMRENGLVALNSLKVNKRLA